MSSVFSFVRFFRRKEWILSAVTVGMILFQVWLDLEIPSYMADITDVVTAGGTAAEVAEKAAAMTGCAVASLLAGISVSALVGWISSSAAKRIREEEFDHIQKFSFSEVDRISSYSLITRSTNDVKQIQDFIGTALESMIKAPVVSVWAVLRISQGDMTWTAATMTAVAAMMILVYCVMKLSAPLYKKVQYFNDGINAVTSEMLDGQRMIRAHNAQEYEKRKFSGANEALAENNIRANHIASVNVPFNGFIRNVLSMSIYWTGAFIIAGNSSEEMRLELFSEMIVFATYATMALNGFRTLMQIFNVFPRAKVSLDRIFEVLSIEPQITDGTETEGNGSGTISFRNVSFRFPGSGADTLENINFDVKHGETVAVIGATGCGKTALAMLIPRFYDCTSGTIEVDGVDVRNYKLDSLRGKIGYVPQKAVILSGTVRHNVGYGSDSYTDGEIWDALDTACIKDFIELEGGLDISLSEEGRNISGGQKQRVSIARAVCRNPEIYVFDDCFSALDFSTDREVRKRLAAKTEGASVLLITQRIGTARTADRILVMDRGRIVDQGTHAELLGRCSIYSEIADSQDTGGGSW